MPRAKLGTKYCPGCDRTLPVSEFFRNKHLKDGLQTYCKECQKQTRKKYYYGIDKQKLKMVRKLVKMLEPYRTAK